MEKHKQIYLEINGKIKKILFKNNSIFYKNMDPIHIEEDISFEDLKTKIIQTDRNKRIGQSFESPFSNDPSKKEKECKEFMEKILKEETLGKGFFGGVRDWADHKGIVVKIESCELFEHWKGFYKDQNPQWKGKIDFLDIKKHEKKIINLLADKGITARIYGFYKCDDNCITFMEKIEGKTVEKYLIDFWDNVIKEKKLIDAINPRRSSNPFTPRPKLTVQEQTIIIRLLKKIGNVIIKFHEDMAKIGYKNLAHGDLNLGNIMITSEGDIKLIDFAFEKKYEWKMDWIIFFRSFGLDTDYGFKKSLIEKIKKQGMSEKYYPISKEGEKII